MDNFESRISLGEALPLHIVMLLYYALVMLEFIKAKIFLTGHVSEKRLTNKISYAQTWHLTLKHAKPLSMS